MESNSIPYFPLMCQLGYKWDLIEAEYGLKGFAVGVKLYQNIYGTQGYYCEWTKEIELLFSRKACGLQPGDNFVSEIVQAALKRDLFSQEIFKHYHVLTSESIQKNFFDAVQRRKNVIVKKEYLLLKVDQIPKNVDIIGENVYTNRKNVNRNTQRREEERIEEERIGKKDTYSPESCQAGSKQQETPEQEAVIKLALNDNSEYPITQKDMEEWAKLYPAVDVLQECRKMVGWIQSNPSKRKTIRGINKFINNWLSREQDNGRRQPPAGGLGATKPKQSRFVNFEQRSWDFNRLEQLEIERRKRKQETGK